MGGTWKEDAAGDLVVFRSLPAPLRRGAAGAPRATSSCGLDGCRSPRPLLDRDPATVVDVAEAFGPARRSRFGWPIRRGPPVGSPPSSSPSISRLRRSRFPGSPRSTARWSRAAPRATALQWVNGAPRAARQALLVVPLAGRAAARFASSSRARARRCAWPRSSSTGPTRTSGRARATSRPRRGPRGGPGGALGRRRAVRTRRRSGRAGARLPPRRLARARWRAARRRRLDVESLSDGGPAVVSVP